MIIIALFFWPWALIALVVAVVCAKNAWETARERQGFVAVGLAMMALLCLDLAALMVMAPFVWPAIGGTP